MILTVAPKRLALDLVGVLEDSWPAKRHYVLSRFGHDLGDRLLSMAEIGSLLQLVSEDYQQLADEMNAAIHTPGALLQHPSIQGAPEGVALLQRCLEVFVLSSRREPKRKFTQQWLKRNGFTISPAHVVLRSLNDSYQGASTKLAWCACNGMWAFVDDDISHLNAAEDYATHRVWFARNGTRDSEGMYPIINTWQHLVSYLNSLP